MGGWLPTKYSSDRFGNGQIDISSRKGEYVVLASDTDANGAASVEGRCIVLHDDDSAGTRVGAGKIVCTADGCKASMGPYPTTDAAPTQPPQPTPQPVQPEGSPTMQAPNTVNGGQTTVAAGGQSTVDDNDNVDDAVTNMLISVSALAVYG